jgi:tetratricopeptide (TPR) repeat protein
MESNVVDLSMQDKLWAWFETHKRGVVRVALGVVVAALGIGLWNWWHGARELNANDALSKVTSHGFSGASESTEALLQVAARYPSTDAAGRAILLAGGKLFAEGKYPEARAQFERYLRDYRDGSFNTQALLGVATCLDAQNKTNEAIAAYRDIADHHATSNAALQARYALGRLYEEQGKFDLARDCYDEVNRADANGSIGSEAGMRLEELIAQHPNLVATNQPAASLTPSHLKTP